MTPPVTKDGWTGRERDLASRDAAADAILADLRDRKLLKYLFNAEPEICGAYGYVEQPIDLETQREIALALTDIAFAKAIAEERERCARIADETAERCKGNERLFLSNANTTISRADHATNLEHAVSCAKSASVASNIATAIRATVGEVGNG